MKRIFYVTELKGGKRVTRIFKFNSIDEEFEFTVKLQQRCLISPELETTWRIERI